MKLLGLDFETANRHNGSICAIGAALLDDGNVTNTREWLVRPHKSMDWMLSRFTEIHGIGYHDLRHAPEFFEIWPVLVNQLLSCDFVVIHNAPFDLRHLHAALQLYKLSSIEFNVICSLAVSRTLFPQMESHSLDAVSAHFGHHFQHHNALADAIACATIIVHTGFPEECITRFEYCQSQGRLSPDHC